MTRYGLTLLFGVLALSACTDESIKSSPEMPSTTMVGGYSKIANPDTDQGLLHVTTFLNSEIGFKDGNPSIRVDKVLEASRQVVAGQNYQVKVQMTDGSQYEAVVYVALNDAMQLTSLKQLRGASPVDGKQADSFPSAPVAGGYNKITDPDQSRYSDQGLFNATKFLSYEIGEKEGDHSIGIDTVLEAYKQVVAGNNYRVKVQMTNGSQYEAVVYMSLQNELSLTSLKKL
ncbi:cystatin domain-containing protein [Thiothrix lacustris]|uniref:Cystatin domain-containing protein n=1 Tax=Thiothrix lacustris TaxID=525917 RepID=A0ABY9MM34_9GAMM|nr:cystatin domain-containing protein [Thiothrix lacustris]WML89725.1 cystatin domain-containing protein [Thiothrix lacustris]WMP18675.1 cystatin domain-containing protein [Thiothrix lacustris]